MGEINAALNLSNRNVIIRAVDHLAELELVEVQYTSSWPLQKFVWLTEKGLRVASIIVELEKALGEK